MDDEPVAGNLPSDNQISFVLPFTLDEALGGPALWRSEVNRDSVRRLKLTVTSVLQMFRQEDLGEFLLICPKEQCAAVAEIVADLTQDARYRVLSEHLVAPNIGKILKTDIDGMGGWYAQQIIKLAAAAVVRTKYYMTMDSDIACIRSCDYHSFMEAGLPILNTETSDDYARIYLTDFAREETTLKARRWAYSAKIIGHTGATNDLGYFYGETPIIFSTSHVLQLIAHINAIYRTDWVSVLNEYKNWTEYGLYFNFLDMLGMTNTVYAMSHCNAILDLEKSVWQESIKYTTSRAYDHEHFFAKSQGYFVAIQSWIPTISWLPSRYASKKEFYADLEQWIHQEAINRTAPN